MKVWTRRRQANVVSDEWLQDRAVREMKEGWEGPYWPLASEVERRQAPVEPERLSRSTCGVESSQHMRRTKAYHVLLPSSN